MKDTIGKVLKKIPKLWEVFLLMGVCFIISYLMGTAYWIILVQFGEWTGLFDIPYLDEMEWTFLNVEFEVFYYSMMSMISLCMMLFRIKPDIYGDTDDESFTLIKNVFRHKK